jgi:hypothetical protein
VGNIEDTPAVRKFLDENHVQGFAPYSLCVGLKNGEHILAVMCFKRRAFGWELSRMCFKLETAIIGGAEKMLHYFLKSSSGDILTFNDRGCFSGAVYERLGFKLDKVLPPSYKYTDGKVRLYKQLFRKSKMVKDGYSKLQTEYEIAHSLRYYRIFDSGLGRYLYKR